MRVTRNYLIISTVCYFVKFVILFTLFNHTALGRLLPPPRALLSPTAGHTLVSTAV